MATPINFSLYWRTALVLSFCIIFSSISYSQTRNFSGAYSENFDSLSASGSNTWIDDTTIDGWQSSRTTYNADNGNNNGGGLYSYGTTAATDRSLGSLASSGTGTVTYGVCFTNTTGVTIQNINVSYTGEQWRVGSTQAVGDTIAFSYQTGVNSVTTGGTWTLVPALNFVAPTNSPNNSAVNGNVSPNRASFSVVSLTNLNVPNGGNFCFRWQDADNTGSDYATAIDDLTVSLVPTAANSVVRGKLLAPNGRGLSNATVVLTNATTGEIKYTRSSAFGYFHFDNCESGNFYILDVPSKRFRFDQTSFTLNGDLTDLILTAQ